jgi:hypothetical protein
MNCFEARQEFGSFWRRELSVQRRAALTEHLRKCARCEEAFRLFALSAPVLHSASEPERATGAARPVRGIGPSLRAPGVYRGASPRAGLWLSMCAVLVVFFAGAFAAYLSVSRPVESLADALSQTEPFAQTLGVELQTPAGNDFAE